MTTPIITIGIIPLDFLTEVWVMGAKLEMAGFWAAGEEEEATGEDAGEPNMASTGFWAVKEMAAGEA